MVTMVTMATRDLVTLVTMETLVTMVTLVSGNPGILGNPMQYGLWVCYNRVNPWVSCVWTFLCYYFDYLTLRQFNLNFLTHCI